MCLTHDIGDHQVVPGQDDESTNRSLASHMSFTAGAHLVHLLEFQGLISLWMLKVSTPSTMAQSSTLKREYSSKRHLISQNRRLDMAGRLHNANHN